jgi:hypothetical protein
MASFEDATDDELVAVASRYPAEFTPKHADRWQEYFEALERRHLVDGLRAVVDSTYEDRDRFAWLLAPFVSRLNTEPILDLLDGWSKEFSASRFVRIVESCSTFAATPETRRVVRERYDSFFEDVTDAARRGIDLQFCDSPLQFRRDWLHGWVTEYRSSVSYLTRCALLDFDRNPEDSVHIWAHGFPVRPAEPTETLLSGLRGLYEETQSHYADRDEPLELYKGTTFKRTIASSAESWTDDEGVADEYDGHSVLERAIDPETVLLSYKVVADRANVYTPQARNTFIADSEYVVFGGGIE